MAFEMVGVELWLMQWMEIHAFWWGAQDTDLRSLLIRHVSRLSGKQSLVQLQMRLWLSYSSRVIQLKWTAAQQHTSLAIA
jgi:hypothetical protein